MGGSCCVCVIKAIAFLFVFPIFLIRVLIGLCCNPCGFLRVKKHMFPQHLWDEFNHKNIQLSEVDIHYVDEGPVDGPLMVLIHGFPEYWYTWRHQIRYFSKKYRVIALDQRGFGHSSKPKGIEHYKQEKMAADIKELINALGYDKAILIGHDWGGTIAWYVASVYPEIVDRMASLAIPHPRAYGDALEGTFEQKKKAWYLLFFQLPCMPEILWRSNDNSIVDDCVRDMINKENMTEEVIEAWKSMYPKKKDWTSPMNYYRALFFEGNLETISSKIPAPVLIVWGENEAYVVKETAEGSLAYCENGRIEYIPRASHWIQQDQPLLVSQAIERFLEEKITPSSAHVHALV